MTTSTAPRNAASRGEGNSPSPNLQTITDEEQALDVCKQAILSLETARRSLARVYAHLEGDSPAEHAIGELMVRIRKAKEQGRKSLDELAKATQGTLPWDSEG